MPTRTLARAANGLFRVEMDYHVVGGDNYAVDVLRIINETDQLDPAIGDPAPGRARIYRSDNGNTLYDTTVQPGQTQTVSPQGTYPETIRQRIVVDAIWPS